MKHLMKWFMLLAVVCSCSDENKDQNVPEEEPDAPAPVPTTYSNPVSHMSLPDPTVLEDEGVFYLYATEDTRNVPIMVSNNLVTWRQVGTVFNDSNRPNFVQGGGIWAPDVNKIGNRYVLYYSMSEWGGGWDCGIGVAIADNPDGRWYNRGKLFISSEIGVWNSIDPFFIEDKGKNYLFWGSYGGGIWSVELSDDGLSIKEGAKKVQVAADTYEGTYIHKKGNYYYMFASINNCCDGFNSIYTTVVGRSESLHGPYLNKKGESMRTGLHHEVVIEGDGVNFFGTGHNSEIVTDKNGDDWILYHAYAKMVGDRSRALMLDKVTWVDGWPEVNAGYPSKVADRPVF